MTQRLRFLLQVLPVYVYLVTIFLPELCPAQVFPVLHPIKKTYERLAENRKEYDAVVARGDSEQIAQASYVLAKRYQEVGDSTRGHYFFSQAIRMHRHSGPSELVGKVYERLGCWAMEGEHPDPPEALRRMRLAKYHFESVGKSERLFDIYKAMGVTHETGWQIRRPGFSLDSALYYHERAVQESEIRHDTLSLLTAWQFQGRVLFSKEEYEKAIEVLKKASRFAGKITIKDRINILTLLAKSYLGAGQPSQARQQLDSARILINNHSSELRGIDWVLLYLGYRRYYEFSGDLKTASHYQEMSYVLWHEEMRLYHKEAREEMASLQEKEMRAVLLEKEKQELQLRLHSENRRRFLRIGLLLMALGLGLGVVGWVYYRLYRRYREVSLRNEALVREQSHRIKNNLQSISDLLTLQLYGLSDPMAVQALEESLSRINAMALIHRRLYDGEEMEAVELDTFIPKLVQQVLESYHLDTIVAVGYASEVASLPVDEAITLALMINELVTNSCKYAFSSHHKPLLQLVIRSGRVTRDSLQQNRRKAPAGEIQLEYGDNGPGFIPDPDRPGFGQELIGILVERLRGSYTFTNEMGSCFRLSYQTEAWLFQKDRKKTSKQLFTI